jgi:hypothetical protein
MNMTDEVNIVNDEPEKKLSTVFLPEAMRSEGIAQLAEALAKAQGKIQNPAKESQNPHFRSRYADLATGINAIRAALSECGIAVIQTTDFQDELLVLTTRLIHSSGEWIGSRWPVCVFTKVTVQQIGSSLTYARRYSLFPLVGIAGDDDDDGNAAQTAAPIPAGAVKRIDDDQFAELQDLINEARLTTKDFASLGNIQNYTINDYEVAKVRLTKRIAAIKDRQP